MMLAAAPFLPIKDAVAKVTAAVAATKPTPAPEPSGQRNGPHEPRATDDNLKWYLLGAAAVVGGVLFLRRKRS